MNRDLLRDELIADEGFRKDSEGRHTAYKDSLGNWTIGYGHLLGDKPTLVSCVEDTARALLEQDIDAAILKARRIVYSFDALDDDRQRALANLTFNLGNRLLEFRKFLAAVTRRDWPEAVAELKDSKWWEQIGDERKNRIASQIAGKPNVEAA